MAQKQVYLLLFVAVVALAGGLGLHWLIQPAETGLRVQSKGSTGAPKVGGAFQLVDHTGKVMTDADLRGRPALIFFGYTNCPDVCPMTMLKITEALDLMGPEGASIQPVFITVDPLRDTPEAVADYIANFHPRFIGLTGTRQQIAAVERSYAVYARAADGAQKDENYLVDHTALAYLMGPDGTLRTFVSQSATPEQMALKLIEYL